MPAAIPKLTRSALHRCLQRPGISRLPANEDKASKRGHVADTKIGFVHVDSCELRLAEGKLFMFLAIDRVSKFTAVAFHDSAGKMAGAAFLRPVVATFPYAIHTVLTDNGVAFALRVHVLAFVSAYNFAKHLKALQWQKPFQSICDAWQRDPSASKIYPHNLIPGPNT